MNVHVLPSGPIATNAYLLTAPELREAVLVDAPGGVWPLVAPLLAAERCRLGEIWLTHGHWDHTQGGPEVVAATGARVRAHEADRLLIEHPEVMEMFMIPGMRQGALKIDLLVQPGQRWTALGETVEVRHVPGHCPGNVLFYFAAGRTAFVGDALFHSGVGRTDLPGGSLEVLERSIREQIFTLPDDTVVYPGHGPETTVGAEREGNPFVHA